MQPPLNLKTACLAYKVFEFENPVLALEGEWIHNTVLWLKGMWIQHRHKNSGKNCIIQAGLDLHDFFLHDFALIQLENLHHFPNSGNNFWLNMIWQRQSMTAFIFCRKLAENDITVMQSATRMAWLCWWFNHAAHVVSSSTEMVFLPTWQRNVNLHHLVKSKWKTGKRQSVLKRNYTQYTNLKKVNYLLTYATALDLLIIVHIQFVLMLTELNKLDIVGTVNHLVIYMQSNKIHKVF